MSYFSRGSINRSQGIYPSISGANAAYAYKEGDIITVVADFEKQRVEFYRNEVQIVHFDIDKRLEGTEWFLGLTLPQLSSASLLLD